MLGLQTTPRRQARDLSPRELDLISAAQRGDISAFNQLVRSYQELAYRLAFHVLEDAHAAEDATGRAFESAYRQIRHWNGDAFKIWLLRIVISECKRAASGRKRARDVFAPSPIEIGLAILSPEERVICVLADVLGLNEGDVAQITNAAVSTIRATRSRARRQIRDVLEISARPDRFSNEFKENSEYSRTCQV